MSPPPPGPARAGGGRRFVVAASTGVRTWGLIDRRRSTTIHRKAIARCLARGAVRVLGNNGNGEVFQ